MTDQRKHRLLQALVAVVFVYLLATQVYGRWATTVGLMGELRSQQSAPLSFDEYVAKKSDLIARRRHLVESLSQHSGKFSQSPTGVFDLLTATAKASGIHLAGLTPKEIREEGQFRAVAFKVSFASTYHAAGGYVNALEGGSIPIAVEAISLSAEPAGNTRLSVSLEGRAYVLSER